jgi:hypothetical protein
MESDLKPALIELAKSVGELAQEVELLMEQNIGRVAIGQIGATKTRIKGISERIEQTRKRIEEA